MNISLFKEKLKDKAIIYYYFGECVYQDGSHFMITNLKLKLFKYLTHIFPQEEQTPYRFEFGADTFLQDAIAAISIPIIIIVDGLDKADLRQQRKYQHEFPFLWLSSLVTDHTYIIISAQTNSNLHETISNHSHYPLELQLWTGEQRSLYIDMFFHRFNKVR